MFYRVVANTNSTITEWNGTGQLTWTVASTGGTFTIEAISDLASSTNVWGTVAYGEISGTIMSCQVPTPDSPFPDGSPMVLIPAGEFMMGDIYHDYHFRDSEGPPHIVMTSAFYMDSTEITWAQWSEVVDWATNNGYVFDNSSPSYTETNFPIYDVSWYDCVKWCNARSEKEGRPVVYYTNETWTVPYREGQIDLVISNVDWNSRGYRLPTEAEWEKAARGGLNQNHYPWHSPGPAAYFLYITPTNANYSQSGNGQDSTGTTAVATFPPNGYGLYEMAGNVAEWCWDYWDYYPDPAVNNLRDPDGPILNADNSRVVRGGSQISQSSDLRCAARTTAYSPTAQIGFFIGFRCVRSCRSLPAYFVKALQSMSPLAQPMQLGIPTNLKEELGVSGVTQSALPPQEPIPPLPEPKPSLSSIGNTSFQQLIESVDDGAIITDLTGKIVDANSRVMSCLQYPRPKLLTLCLPDIISSENDITPATRLTCIEKGRPILIQGYCVRYDNTLIPCEITVSRLHVMGKEYICYLIHEISWQRQVENMLRLPLTLTAGNALLLPVQMAVLPNNATAH